MKEMIVFWWPVVACLGIALADAFAAMVIFMWISKKWELSEMKGTFLLLGLIFGILFIEAEIARRCGFFAY